MTPRSPVAPVPDDRSSSGRVTAGEFSSELSNPGLPVTDRPDTLRARRERTSTTRGEADTPGRRELLLDVLLTSPQPRSILSLADQLGVHANTVRFHLETLLRTGQVEQLLGDTTGPGRPPVLFRATRRMDPDGPTNYRLLASILTSHLASSSPNPAVTATELGRVWGPHLLNPTTTGRARTGRATRGEALTSMTRVLGALGFAPDPPTGPRDTTIRLRHCPFLGLVTGSLSDTERDVDTGSDTGTGYREVICSLHLGLMQGALASLQAPVTVEGLDPFVEPDLCVAHLVPTKSASSGRQPSATGAGRANG